MGQRNELKSRQQTSGARKKHLVLAAASNGYRGTGWRPEPASASGTLRTLLDFPLQGKGANRERMGDVTRPLLPLLSLGDATPRIDRIQVNAVCYAQRTDEGPTHARQVLEATPPLMWCADTNLVAFGDRGGSIAASHGHLYSTAPRLSLSSSLFIQGPT